MSIIGGGLVGVELVGELTAFADDVLRFYPRVRRDELCFRLFEAGPRILPEVDSKLAATAARGFSQAAQVLKSKGSFAGLAKLMPYPEINGFFATDYHARDAGGPRSFGSG